MFYGWCAQANAKGRGKYEEYKTEEKLNCHDVDECTKILADAQMLRQTQNAEIDKWNQEMKKQVADKEFAEQKDKIEEIYKLGIKIASMQGKLYKAKAREMQLATVKTQQREIFKEMQEMYSLAAERAASDGGNLKSVAMAFKVTDENMKMTDYDAIPNEQTKAEAMENIVLLGQNDAMQKMTVRRLMEINHRGLETTKWAKLAEKAYNEIIYQKYTNNFDGDNKNKEEFELI